MQSWQARSRSPPTGFIRDFFYGKRLTLLTQNRSCGRRPSVLLPQFDSLSGGRLACPPAPPLPLQFCFRPLPQFRLPLFFISTNRVALPPRVATKPQGPVVPAETRSSPLPPWPPASPWRTSTPRWETPRVLPPHVCRFCPLKVPFWGILRREGWILMIWKRFCGCAVRIGLLRVPDDLEVVVWTCCTDWVLVSSWWFEGVGVDVLHGLGSCEFLIRRPRGLNSRSVVNFGWKIYPWFGGVVSSSCSNDLILIQTFKNDFLE